MHIVFVCSGNICRSPFAEVLARAANERPELSFSSAGTIALSGNPASAPGVAVAADLGVDMTGHRATHLTAEVVTAADLIYAMEDEHIASVLALDEGARVELLSPDGRAIPDPYGGDLVDYRASYELIREAVLARLGLAE